MKCSEVISDFRHPRSAVSVTIGGFGRLGFSLFSFAYLRMHDRRNCTYLLTLLYFIRLHPEASSLSLAILIHGPRSTVHGPPIILYFMININYTLLYNLESSPLVIIGEKEWGMGGWGTAGISGLAPRLQGLQSPVSDVTLLYSLLHSSHVPL